MTRITALVAAIVLASTTHPVVAEPAVRRAMVRWVYQITPAPDTETINFRCLIPRDRDDWQKVVQTQLSHQATERIPDGRDTIARFFFRNPRQPITLVVGAVVELRPAGLSNRRPAAGLRLDDAQRKAATSPERYIESDAPEIQTLAEKVSGNTAVERLRSIQELTESALDKGEYDPTDRGALAALKAGKGDCSEYADLFVALCRAKNIPAVVCEGFTIDGALFKRNPPYHNWVMVWLDDRGWTRFDPIDVDSRLARHEAQSFWYVHLTDQRNSEALKGHLYRIDWTGGEAKVEWRFEVAD